MEYMCNSPMSRAPHGSLISITAGVPVHGLSIYASVVMKTFRHVTVKNSSFCIQESIPSKNSSPPHNRYSWTSLTEFGGNFWNAEVQNGRYANDCCSHELLGMMYFN
ncbi:hypothetical protein KQX54_008190 [Cotesia glomerata]|uniref:Uncharacterized protein n=1 Tax=Cotesia glomerata TaxID=32391 RepID=A0AAV7I1G0_COTGL|nr:hypothetical protein KQX54_008190 [Cotesia glomerata]